MTHHAVLLQTLLHLGLCERVRRVCTCIAGGGACLCGCDAQLSQRKPQLLYVNSAGRGALQSPIHLHHLLLGITSHHTTPYRITPHRINAHLVSGVDEEQRHHAQ